MSTPQEIQALVKTTGTSIKKIDAQYQVLVWELAQKFVRGNDGPSNQVLKDSWFAVDSAINAAKLDLSVLAASVLETIEPPNGGGGGDQPPSGDYGPTKGLLLEKVAIGEYGGTPFAKLCADTCAKGGTLENYSITGSSGCGPVNNNIPGPAIPEITFRDCEVLPFAPDKTKWGFRLYNAPMTFERVRVYRSSPEHGIYCNPRDHVRVLDCLLEETAGQALQFVCRPNVEGGAFSDEVTIRALIKNCHKPLSNGQVSSMAGPLVGLYALGPNCKQTLDLLLDQSLYAQMGPTVTCVPAAAAGEYMLGEAPVEGKKPTWWKPGDITSKSLDVKLQGKFLAPQANELFRIAGCPTISLTGALTILSPGKPRILIEPTYDAGGGNIQPLYGKSVLQSLLIDLKIVDTNGANVECPIEVEGKTIGVTGKGVITLP